MRVPVDMLTKDPMTKVDTVDDSENPAYKEGHGKTRCK